MVMEGSVFTGQLVNHARELECPRTCTFKGFTPPNGPENFIGLIPHRSPATQFSLVAGGAQNYRVATLSLIPVAMQRTIQTVALQ